MLTIGRSSIVKGPISVLLFTLLQIYFYLSWQYGLLWKQRKAAIIWISYATECLILKCNHLLLFNLNITEIIELKHFTCKTIFLNWYGLSSPLWHFKLYNFEKIDFIFFHFHKWVKCPKFSILRQWENTTWQSSRSSNTPSSTPTIMFQEGSLELIVN